MLALISIIVGIGSMLAWAVPKSVSTASNLADETSAVSYVTVTSNDTDKYWVNINGGSFLKTSRLAVSAPTTVTLSTKSLVVDGEFVEWRAGSADGGFVSSEQTCTVSVESDITFVAVWKSTLDE